MSSLAIYVFSNSIPFEGEVSCENLMLLGELQHNIGSRNPMARLCIGRSQQQKITVIDGVLIQVHKKWRLLFPVLHLQDLL